MDRLLIAGSLVLGVAAMGCGDSDDEPPLYDSGMDSGSPKDGGTDAKTDSGRDSSMGPTVMCGSTLCEGTVIANTEVSPCCLEEENACGLDADDIKKASPASPFTGCVPKDVAPASDSEYCGAFFDQIEPDGDHTNAGLDIRSGVRFAVFDGCCLPSGECGANISVPRGADPSLNTHLGCVSFGRLSEAFTDPDAGGEKPPTPEHLPFCNPENGEAPTTGTVPGVPAFVCGCGAGNLDDGEGFPCLNNLPAAVCGADEPTDEQLAGIPEFMCGCTADSKLPCLQNVPSTVCGGKEITADSAELAAIPEFICGAGAIPTSLPTLANVEETVCGKKPITADSTELDAIPEFICGCTATSRLPCFRNVEAEVCGKVAITADSAELDAIPQFICGAIGNPLAAVLPAMLNVEVAVCGKKVITADSVELNGIPAFICGAVNNPDPSLPKLPNVDTAICGKAAVATGSVYLAGVPKFVCGCTDSSARELGCLRNVAVTVCGAAAPSAAVLAAVPEFVCGCGATTQDSGFLKLCMSFVDTATCGTRNTLVTDQGTVPTLDDCLTGIPEYAVGCGEDVTTPPANNPSCLPRAAAFLGCVDIPAATPALPRVPEYVCGCGNAPTDVAQPFPAYPCLSRVNTTICGATPITASSQVAGVTNNVCGCGDGISDASNCVKNVPNSICGAIPVCSNCPAGVTTCQDTNGDGIGNACVPVP
jgi:hypothetical protein